MIEEALNHLNNYTKDIVDKMYLNEMKGNLLYHEIFTT